MASLDRARISEMDAAVASGQCPSHLAPLWSLSGSNGGLFQKLLQDPLAGIYSIYGFFPQVYSSVYESDHPPEIAFSGRTRGQVAIFRDGNAGLVVKPQQNRREHEVAALAGGLGAGPRQFSSIPGFLTEEFVPDCFFTELPPERVTPECVFKIGHNLGLLLLGLHQQQIYYNDVTLSDPSGRSHLIVLPDNSCRLIDFGVSLLLDRHPDLTLEETYNFVRTLPMFQVFTRMGVAGEETATFLKQYQHRLARASIREIMARDLRFLEEGLRLAAGRMGEGIVEPLRRGFQESYYGDGSTS